MFNWYRRAEICYAYLFGLKSREDFCKSRWFTRGWTLQELLAPADVLFFDDSWVQIGFKTSLSSFIALGTGINERALRNGGNFEDFSFAEKMSWAADRRTTRPEDEAYCLIGLLDVNIPLIYGEGRKAFWRLQEELLKRSDDASMFAYIASHSTTKHPGPSTLQFARPGHDRMFKNDPDDDLSAFGSFLRLEKPPNEENVGSACVRDPRNVNVDKAEAEKHTSLGINGPDHDKPSDFDIGLQSLSGNMVKGHIDTQIYIPLDEDPKEGMQGLLASSPAAFRNSAYYRSHRLPVLEWQEPGRRTVSKRKALAIQVNGRFVRFHVPVWRLPIPDLQPHTEELDSTVSRDIFRKYRLTLTPVSLRKLRKCTGSDTAETGDVIVAFLDCCRRNAGALGMILRTGNKAGIYCRHHFPSLVEITSDAVSCNGGSIQMETLYVEADSLHMTNSRQYDPNFLFVAYFEGEYGESIKIQSLNLDKFGYIWKEHSSHDGWRYITSSRNEFPHIEFSDHQVRTGARFLGQSLEVFDGQKLACTLHVIADAFKSTENQAHRPQTRTEQGPHIIAVDRGSTTVIGLNNEYDLRLRTQLQWKRMERDMHTENLKRQCLLMISIVPRSSLT
jgi:hypothetical protein